MSVYISAIGTANPPHQITQADAGRFMAEAMALNSSDKRKLQAVYRVSGIRRRHSVLADYTKSFGYYDFFPNSEDLEPFPSTQDRMAVYNAEAPKLAEEASRNCLAQLPQLDPAEITHLITISCTGMHAPGLDIALVQSLGLKTSVNRTCVYFMGCYAAINGLKLAQSICQANPANKVLVVSVELCTLHFQKKNDEDNLLANALFADGAAATLVEGEKRPGLQLSLDQFYCDLALDGLGDMAWHIGDTGFEMKLSSYIPAFIKGGVVQLLEGLLRELPEVKKEEALFAIHPGGRRILEVSEEALGLEREDNRYSYSVLQDYGNMSSATVLFVLKEIFDDASRESELAEVAIDQEEKRVEEHRKNGVPQAVHLHKQFSPTASISENNFSNGRPIISFAFGPGLTLESMLLRISRS